MPSYFNTMLYYDAGLIIGYKQFSIKSEISDVWSLAMSPWISFIYFKHKLVFSKMFCILCIIKKYYMFEIKFFAILSHGGRKESFQEASCAVSSCWRTHLGNVCMPKSLAVFELVWSALWNTLGQVVDRARDEQSGEVTSPAPIT